MLIISEAGEAMEAHRKGKRADLELFEQEVANIERFYPNSENKGFYWGSAFIGHIKDSVADEIADIVIRVLDFAGYLELNIDMNDDDVQDLCGVTNIGEMLCDACEYIVQSRVSFDYNASDRMKSDRLCQVLRQVFGIAEFLNIDLMRHIELKLMYNKTRPYKHGKNY